MAAISVSARERAPLLLPLIAGGENQSRQNKNDHHDHQQLDDGDRVFWRSGKDVAGLLVRPRVFGRETL